jgi:hypothetical protein
MMALKKLEDGTAVFVCTEEEMRPGEYGGYVLPRDPRATCVARDEERVHLLARFQGFDALRKLGWREARYAPQDGTPFLAIEAGSTGVHECSRNPDGHFWIYDGDMWPARPILWKPKPATPPEGDPK